MTSRDSTPYEILQMILCQSTLVSFQDSYNIELNSFYALKVFIDINL